MDNLESNLIPVIFIQSRDDSRQENIEGGGWVGVGQEGQEGGQLSIHLCVSI